MKRVLIIGGVCSGREELLYLFKKEKAQLFSVEKGVDSLSLLKSNSFDLIFSDFKGIQALKRLRHWPLKGSLIYIKMQNDPHILDVKKMLVYPFDKKEVKKIVQSMKSQRVIAASPQMQHILLQVEKVAQSCSNVFIHGESGTGKEVIAGMLHHLSKRAQHPFVCTNCAAFSDTLIESELFGHEKGAFTGAFQMKKGRFELAHLGSLLLDEISEIPAALQAKLLRVVQEQEFERVGGIHTIPVDVRLVSTSNRNMKEMIRKHNFREDLYYRLNVIPIYLPPLRERKEDILPLAQHFLEEICNHNQLSLKTLSQAAKNKLYHYSWPGNIRELRNTIEYGVVVNSSNQLEEDHLFFESFDHSIHHTLHRSLTLKELEKEHILLTLKRCVGNRTKTAQILGISVRTLRNKLKLWHL